MGEFKVHHVRFFEYTPQAVQCLAYNRDKNKLAVARSDGSIEIWNLNDSWYHEDLIPGKKGQTVEDLVWQGNRLFSAGLDGFINEIDLVTLQIKRNCSSNAGPVWCLSSNPAGNQLAAGTEGACVVLLNTDNDTLEFSTRFESQESRILCLSWHATDSVMVTGGVDNIRLWSTSSGRALQRITLARQDKHKETVVWCVALLSDMTIVSGDSRGKTTFWNGKHGTVIKSVQSHKADVYSLAVDLTETCVVSSGVDSSVVQFNYIAARENSDWRDWVGTFLHNHHSHDVRAVQIVGNMVVTGGVDTNLIEFDMNQGGKSKDFKHKDRKWRRVVSLPQRPVCHMVPSLNVLLLQYTNYLEVWRLGHTSRSGVNGDILPLSSNPIKLIQLKTKGGNPVYCCCISHDASLIAYSDNSSIRMYRISMVNLKSIQPDVEMSRIPVDPERAPDGAHCMSFMSSGFRVVTVTSSSRLQVSSLASGKLAVEHTFPAMSESYHLLCVSADDRYVAAADHQCNVHIYSLAELKHVCSVPRDRSQVTAMAFSPDGRTLVMAYTNQKIIEFDVAQGEYTNWTKRHVQRFMPTWLKRKSKITNILYNPSNPDQIVFHDEQMFCILDKTQPFPDPKVKWLDLCSPNPDRPSAFHLCKNYKFLLHLEVLPGNWLVAVERPPLDFYGSLPEALKRKKFGT